MGNDSDVIQILHFYVFNSAFKNYYSFGLFFYPVPLCLSLWVSSFNARGLLLLENVSSVLLTEIDSRTYKRIRPDCYFILTKSEADATGKSRELFSDRTGEIESIDTLYTFESRDMQLNTQQFHRGRATIVIASPVIISDRMSKHPLPSRAFPRYRS